MSRLPVFLSLGALLAPGIALAETTLCTEIVPPITLAVPGSYCLFNDYALKLTSGAAITVTANNVTIDLNGHRLGNGGGGTANLANGIDVTTPGLLNLTVRNGTVRGFHRGISISAAGGGGHMVEDVLADQNLAAGIWVLSDRSTLRRNRITGTGSTTTLVEMTRALHANGSENRIVDNDVSQTVSLATASQAIHVRGEALLVADNKVTQTSAAAGGIEHGIYISSGSGTVTRNVINDTAAPAGGNSYGIQAAATTIKIVGNIATVSDIGFSGGNQIAGTNY